MLTTFCVCEYIISILFRCHILVRWWPCQEYLIYSQEVSTHVPTVFKYVDNYAIQYIPTLNFRCNNSVTQVAGWEYLIFLGDVYMPANCFKICG